MSFYGDLTALRKDGVIAKDRVKAAQAACRGGIQIADLAALARFLDKKFPSGLGYFDASMSAGAFPSAIAAFKVSVYGGWSKIAQHGIYVVFGDHIIRRLQDAKESFATKEKYRDELAGAKQHYVNGLMYCVKEAHGEGLDVLALPCFPEPRSLLECAQEAVSCQRLAANLRAEKYAAPGGSGSHVKSYKSSLENLATTCRILSLVDPASTAKNAKVAEFLEKKASALLLSSDPEVLDACSKGLFISSQVDKTVKAERRAPTVASSLLPPPEVTSPERCVVCKTTAPSHWGYTCRCKCICEGCLVSDTLVECPMCGDYTEFVLAV